MTSTGARWADMVRLRLRSLWRKSPVEQELDEELRFHIETLADKYEAQGRTRAEARRMASIEMGNGVEAIREECRDARGWNFAENLWRDVQYALRGMAKNPLFTLTAAGALALGIGANSAVFTLVYSLMYRPIPVAQPETMRNVHMATFGQGNRSSFGTQYNISWQEFHSVRAGTKSAELAGLAEVTMSRKDDPRPVRTQLASDNLLPLIGGRPELGRFFLPEEVRSPGSAAVTVLSYRMWRSRFGGDPGVIGKQVVMNRTPFTIVGVADERTTGPALLVPDVWIPLSMQALTRPGDGLIDNPRMGWIQVIGRVRPGYSDAAVQSELQGLFQNALASHTPSRKAAVTVAPAAFFNYPFIQQKSAPVIAVLFLAVGLVLVVACANVANMLLARGLARRKEIAIRLSIGAGRARLLQQLLTESVLLAVVGGGLGLLLALFGSRSVLAAMPLEYLERHQVDLNPDWRVLLFTFGVSVLTGIVFGLIPAWNSLRFQVSPNLKAEGLADAGRPKRQRLQFALIAVQAAVCLVLLVNAGLLVRGFRAAVTGDSGQAMRDLVTLSFDLRQQQYTGEQATRFIDGMREGLAGVPMVRSTATTFVEPLHQQCGTSIEVPTRTGGERRSQIVGCDEVGPGYLSTVGVRLLAGREFTQADQASGDVAIIDETLADLYFGGRDALGKTVQHGPNGKLLNIVGVARTTRTLDMGIDMKGKLYTPMRGARHLEAMLVASYAGPFSDVATQVRAVAARLDPNVTVQMKRVEESVKDALLPARLASAAAAALGGLALVLAATGIYGVVAFAVTRRRKEMGIRVALGADRSGVMRLMLWQGMQPVVVGAVAGLVLAGAGAQLIRSLLYGVSPFDPVAFAGMALVLALSGGLAAMLPARAALAVDPAVTLRQE